MTGSASPPRRRTRRAFRWWWTCAEPFVNASNPGHVPASVKDARTKDFAPLNDCVMDRHGKTTNVVFLDGHAEAVPLLDLWKLKWSGLWK